MIGPEDNPADDVPADKDEWEEWDRRQQEYGENYISGDKSPEAERQTKPEDVR